MCNLGPGNVEHDSSRRARVFACVGSWSPWHAKVQQKELMHSIRHCGQRKAPQTESNSQSVCDALEAALNNCGHCTFARLTDVDSLGTCWSCLKMLSCPSCPARLGDLFTLVDPPLDVQYTSRC